MKKKFSKIRSAPSLAASLPRAGPSSLCAGLRVLRSRGPLYTPAVLRPPPHSARESERWGTAFAGAAVPLYPLKFILPYIETGFKDFFNFYNFF
jgi:hypothetical protein